MAQQKRWNAQFGALASLESVVITPFPLHITHEHNKEKSNITSFPTVICFGTGSRGSREEKGMAVYQLPIFVHLVLFTQNFWDAMLTGKFIFQLKLSPKK